MSEYQQGDIRNLFGAFERVAVAVQMDEKKRELRVKLHRIGTTCGDCSKWMKSSQCPAERNVNGRNVGPSMNAPRCAAFNESSEATTSRAEMKARIAELEAGR